MNQTETLAEREELILRAVVQSHITTAGAVGSRSIVKRFGLDLSPATARNVMADLEDGGYLEQLHTSSGRVPTDRGYRYYVDNLMDVQELPKDEQARIDRNLAQGEAIAEELMRLASHLLALVSQQTAIVEAPDDHNAAVRHIEVIAMGHERIGIVFADSIGGVRTVMVGVEKPPRASQLTKLNRFMNDRLRGVTFDKLTATISAQLPKLLDEEQTLAKLALALLELIPSQRHTQLFLDGAARLFEQPEFRDVTKAREVFRLLEKRDRLVDLLRLRKPRQEPPRISVVIGSETQEEGLEGLGEISVVASPYRVGSVTVGMLGVLGPRRMPYSRVFAVVDYTAGSLGRYLTRLAS